MSLSNLPVRMSPARAERRAVLGALAVGMLGAACLGAAPAVAQPPAFGLASLTAMLAGVGVGEATFIERREIALLDRAQLSRGRLSFRAPDSFVRETLAPRAERMAVQGNTLTLSRDGRSRTLQLDSSPEAAVLVEAIRGTLTGNRDALEQHFETGVSGSAARWALKLVPRDARMRGQVAQVTVRGEQAVVREIDVLLADGDRSLMTIEPLSGRPAASRPGAAAASRP